MALTAITAGAKIEDTGAASSQWIRLADKGGIGFAEAFPEAEEYNHSNIKYSSSGERMAYLKGDVVKVDAHWGSPGSYLYLKANTDVPRGIALAQLFSGGYVGDNGYMNYVGQDRSNGATASDKPTTDFVRTNSNLPEPSLAATTNVELKNLMSHWASNNYTPKVVKNGTSIYTPTGNWGVQKWDANVTFKEGDIVLDETRNEVFEFNSLVKGNWTDSAQAAGAFVFYDGAWHQAGSAAQGTDVPHNPATTSTFDATVAYSAGEAIVHTANGTVLIAEPTMKGTWDPKKAYSNGDQVHSGLNWTQLAAAHHGSWNSGQTIANGDTVESNGILYVATTAGNTGLDPAADIAAAPGNWTAIAGVSSDATILEGGASAGATSQTAAVATNGAAAAGGAFFATSPWQVADPSDIANGGASARTSSYLSLSNTNLWTKTHYGELQGQTVGASYTRGDNIFFQGKHYLYVSNLDSDDSVYVSPSNDGYTEFEDLLRLGAVRELPMYVDTMGGGGGAGLQEGVYYRPDQDLEYVDRLPNSGAVRSNSIMRRTDAPLPPGDDIYNSADDQFYGGLNAGNDGIYGTMDDFYATTSDPNVASAGAHVDADSDNNKDLLDESNQLQNFSVADFVDYIQTLANFRAVNGGTMSRLGFAEDMLEENEINLEAATGRIMDADMAAESTKLARQNVLVQAGAAMVTQANAMANIVLSLLQ